MAAIGMWNFMQTLQVNGTNFNEHSNRFNKKLNERLKTIKPSLIKASSLGFVFFQLIILSKQITESFDSLVLN